MTNETIKVSIDGRWELEDFGVFAKQFTQCYSLLYSLSARSQETEFARKGFQFEYSKYPWRGGFSVLNFYYRLYARMPREYRPEVKTIRYASPGAIELSVALEVAVKLGVIVTVVAFTIDRVNTVYNNIQRGIRERKLGRMNVAAEEMKFTKEQLEFLDWAITEISSSLQLSPEYLQVLQERTNGNKLVQLKVLLSLYRRIEPIAEQVRQEMVHFNLDAEKRGNDD